MNESMTNSPDFQEPNYEANLILGLISGVIAMFVSAIIWGAITYFTKFQISWMAIGVGFFVGFVIQKFGKGKTLLFGITGGVLSLLGCMLGNFFFYTGIIAREGGAPFFQVMTYLLFSPSSVLEIFTVAFDIMDLVFYAVAAYIGFATAMDKVLKKS